ncbi:hypothetical protein GCM10008927_15140 [Amylibacter ulvae]|uniref:Saccharopine dehydrogenase n=1 Tax=Paramylibacter ulvae TaxID=1651968 RepID=A0ABQ3D175_9RHOB|nr:SDR family oxidoreductase [Amylibacter ulvae]GHA50855.1 hypothetical protein GCM10008927_15140 [Amylibacter ulvae]
MSKAQTIMILGGYGVFGGRLAELLSDTPFQIYIAGRNLAKARTFCAAQSGTAQYTPIGVDRNAIAPILVDLRPDVLIDATGPFQEYGDDPYNVLSACIAAGVNYLDFADGSDFVYGTSQFDAAAKDADIFMLSGVSSFPVLTAAVIREMENTMVVQQVTGGIAPSPYAGIGLNVMRAVVGYAGGDVKLTRGGVVTRAIGLGESKYFTVAPPGELPLRNLRFSLVDVPDLQVIPRAHPDITDIWMGAGPVPESLHRILNLLAKARAKFNLPAFTRFSPLFYWVLNRMKFGEHRGGMFVHGKGTRKGQLHEMSWHLLAEGDDGPFIPSMAIEVILRKFLRGERPENGARPATNALSLADYDMAFNNRTIITGWRESITSDTPIYRQILGAAFDTLPKQVQDLHNVTRPRRWSGNATGEHGNSRVARIIARMFGFATTDGEIPVSVTFTPSKNSELWERDFDGQKFCSTQSIGTGRDAHLLTERFGVIRVSMALVIRDDRLYLQPRRWSFLGIPMPKFLLPSGDSFESTLDGKFHFNVRIAAPFVGLIAAYRGTLTPDK